MAEEPTARQAFRSSPSMLLMYTRFIINFLTKKGVYLGVILDN